MRDDLKDRFALADDVRAPDLWNEARRRAAASVAPSGAGPGAGPARYRLLTSAVAFAVFTGAVLFAWSIVSTEGRRGRPRPAASTPVDIAAELPVGWSELPAPPEVRSEAATAWTGSELIVWGGYVFDGSGNKTPRDGGFTFDAASSTWTELPASPLDARAAAGSVWTGSELVIWGGWDGGTGVFGDGAAYDPVTRAWRRLPAAPIEAKAPLAVWTGREMVVWGTAVRFPSAPMNGAAYDPASDSWRRIADAPIRLTDATAVWSGEEMIVFGAALDGNNHAETETAVGATYDPETDTWRELPASDLSPQAHTTAWPGAGEMVAWDYEHSSAAYDPASDAWRTLGRVPLEFSECYPHSVAIEGYVFGNFCGQLALYSVNDDAWSELTRDDIADWVVEPAGAGSGFLVMAHSFELSDEPDVTFDTRMLAYVPRGRSALGTVRNPEPFLPATERDGERLRMPVVFPDGSRATVGFPTSLGLETLGVQPDVSYVWRDDPAPRYPIVFLHDPDASISAYVEGARPLYQTRGGGQIWSMSGGWKSRRMLSEGAWVCLRLNSWTVLVAAKTVADAFAVADLVHIRETTAGFPVVEAVGPIGLPEGFGEAEGALLAFGDGAPEPDAVSQLDAAIFLSPDGCNGGTEVGGTYGSSCLADGSVFASIYGDRAFVRNVVEGLSVEAFRPGPPGVT
jgi:hypothetical protein